MIKFHHGRGRGWPKGFATSNADIPKNGYHIELNVCSEDRKGRIITVLHTSAGMYNWKSSPRVQKLDVLLSPLSLAITFTHKDRSRFFSGDQLALSENLDCKIRIVD